MRMPILGGAVVSLLAVALLAGCDPWGGKGKDYQYVVRVLCNGPVNSPLAEATFKTEVTLANNNAVATAVFFKNLTPTGPATPGNLTLDPDSTIGTACTTGATPLPFEAWTTAYTSCNRRLNLTVVYTTETADGVGIEVERIRGRRVDASGAECAGAP